MATSFDELSSDEQGAARDPRPIWTVGWDNEKELHSWLKGEIAFLQKESEEFIRSARKNLALYKGLQYDSTETRSSLRDVDASRSKAVKKVVVNHIHDLVENLVARQVKFKPAVVIIPTNNEVADKLSSKVVKMLLDHIWYERGFENDIYPLAVRVAKIMKESYTFVTWNPDLGELHPDSKPGQEVPLLDESGKPQKDLDGQTVMIEDPVNVGDVEYEVVLPDQVFPQKKKSYKESEYLIRRRVDAVEDLRLRFPKAADKVKASQNTFDFDYEKLTEQKLQNQTVWYELFHKFTKGCPDGRYIVFTDSGILHNEDLPYSDGEFPCERLTDLDIPGELRGESFIINVKQLTSLYNNYTNMVNKSVVFAAQAKWMMPAGAAKLESLGNDHTVVQFKGPIAPQLVTPNPISASLVAFRKEIKEEFQQLAGVFGVSRGEPPAGITAAVALQYLNEQENERHNSSVIKANEYIRRISMKTISRAGDFYDESDGRTLRILGKDNSYMIIEFKKAHLDHDYDVRVQNSSALPQTKSARTQTVIDIAEKFPGIFPPERVLEMLDLSQDDAFLTEGAAAVRKAEFENEKILDGEENVADPVEWDKHIAHWQVHMIKMQDFSFTERTPVEAREKLKDHLRAHEYLMVEIAKKNPIFLQALAQLQQFPVLFDPGAMTPPGAMPQGAQPVQRGQQGQPAQEAPIAPVPEMPIAQSGPPMTADMPVQIPEVPGPVEPSSAI